MDYVLLEPRPCDRPLALFAQRANLMSLHDADHGGTRGRARGQPWARKVLDDAWASHRPGAASRPATASRPCLQPSASAGLRRARPLRAAIAEVTNTYGDRHSYPCTIPTATDQGRRHPDRDQAAARLAVPAGSRGAMTSASTSAPTASASGSTTPRRAAGFTPTYRPARAADPHGHPCLRPAPPTSGRAGAGVIHWQALKIWLNAGQVQHSTDTPHEDISR